jgi:hypothetical protein
MQNLKQGGGLAVSFAASLVAGMLLAPPASRAADTDTGARGYREIRIEPLQLIEAMDSREPASTQDAPPAPATPTELGAEDLERVRKHFRSAFEGELKHVFQVTSEAGPQTLRLESLLIGLELDRQRWLAPATQVFEVVNPITLVIVVSDSVTGEVVQRLAIKDGPVANNLQRQSAPVYWDYLRRLFRRLAIRTRWLLAEPAEGTP